MKTRTDKEIAAQTLYEEVEGIAYTPSGILLHVKGHQQPFKGLPTKEAIEATGMVKRLARGLNWKLLFTLDAFEEVSYMMLTPHFLQYEQLTNTAREVHILLKGLVGTKLARVIAHVVEYDGAYRFRLMDLASETSREEMMLNPRGEIKRLLQINRQRDYQEASDKIEKAGKFLRLLLLYPPFKRRVIRALGDCVFDELQFDPIDTYWAMQKVDYDYFGRKYYAGLQNGNT